MKTIGRVTVEKCPRVDALTRANHVCLRGEDGELFHNQAGAVRTWKTPGGAKSFLRRSAKRYGVGYVVTNLTGTTSLVGVTRQELTMAKNPEQYGPHEWRKANAVTISDGWGTYDIWRCDLCKVEMKRFGLSGRPPGDYCPSNLSPEATGD